MRRFRRVVSALVLSLGLGTALPAAAAELVVLERAGCPWCVRFEAEVGSIWEKTDEGRRATLKRVAIDAAVPADYAFLLPERITPTFVLVHEGREIARLRGYPGAEFFWWHVGPMLARLPQ